LAKLINEIAEKYPDHLNWAKDPKRYEILIAGIRARVASQIISDEKTTRYLISAQNRKIKANQALASLTQLEWQKENRNAIALPTVIANIPVTCPGIFRPKAFRDNGSFNLRSRYEESTVFRRTDYSDIARGRS
jgi:hypothetical protein